MLQPASLRRRDPSPGRGPSLPLLSLRARAQSCARGNFGLHWRRLCGRSRPRARRSNGLLPARRTSRHSSQQARRACLWRPTILSYWSRRRRLCRRRQNRASPALFCPDHHHNPHPSSSNRSRQSARSKCASARKGAVCTGGRRARAWSEPAILDTLVISLACLMHGYRDVGWKCAGKQDVEHGAMNNLLYFELGPARWRVCKFLFPVHPP